MGTQETTPRDGGTQSRTSAFLQLFSSWLAGSGKWLANQLGYRGSSNEVQYALQTVHSKAKKLRDVTTRATWWETAEDIEIVVYELFRSPFLEKLYSKTNINTTNSIDFHTYAPSHF